MPPKAKPPTQQPRPTPPAATAPHNGSPSCSNGAAGGTPCPGFKADLLAAIFKTELQAALTENLSNIKTELWAVKSKLSDSITNIQSDVCALKGTVGEMETSLSSCTDDITTLQAKVAHLSTELIRLDNKCQDLEARSRRNNMRLVGIPEDFSTSSTATAISTLLKEALELQKEPLVDRAHRTLQPKLVHEPPLMMSGASSVRYQGYVLGCVLRRGKRGGVICRLKAHLASSSMYNARHPLFGLSSDYAGYDIRGSVDYSY
ncbi:hypothetical protein D5F01_LYC17969 [Larimichthys crocea]|uniref:Uncharacterized protein n=1 Tax=Larimichthys crocea TaxID=215358 RepID=A0A6G0HZM3_LARCR|nr:hypothetical protein D5F01_LYC17969 [Larimichthys crocea]